MTPTAIMERPAIHHAVARELRTVADLRSVYRSAPGHRRPQLAKLIAEHVAHLAAVDAAEDDPAALLMLAREEVRDD